MNHDCHASMSITTILIFMCYMRQIIVRLLKPLCVVTLAFKHKGFVTCEFLYF